MWTARAFDGMSPVTLWCRLEIANGELCVWPSGQRFTLSQQATHSVASLREAGLCLHNGLRLQIESNTDTFAATAFSQGLPANGFQRMVERTMASWPLAILSLAVLLGWLVCLDQWILPKSAQLVARHLPHQWQDELGQAVIGQLQQQKYRLTYPHPDDTRWSPADFAARVYTQEPDLKFRITMVEPPTKLEWNALALPGGHVLAYTTLLDILSPEEMSAVIAHEIGHVKHRHGMQSLAKGVGLTAIAILTVGDFSVVASSLAVGARTMAYSREMEEEADRYAVNLLKQLQIPPERLGQALAAIEAAAHAKHPPSDIPQWMSTHPKTATRFEKAQKSQDR